jgi:hypothetical protein
MLVRSEIVLYPDGATCVAPEPPKPEQFLYPYLNHLNRGHRIAIGLNPPASAAIATDMMRGQKKPSVLFTGRAKEDG